jgi:hypothetical protein
MRTLPTAEENSGINNENYCNVSLIVFMFGHVSWVPCHHDMGRPQFADGGEGLDIWRVAANILNKQSRIGEKG